MATRCTFGQPALPPTCVPPCTRSRAPAPALARRLHPRSTVRALLLTPSLARRLQPFLGVGPAHNVKLYTILSPVGPYYPEGFAPVKLYASREYVRAWPGGTGGSKVGA